MTAAATHNVQFTVDSDRPTFLEQWVAGTYLVSGVFPIDGNSLAVDQVMARVPALYAATKSQKRIRWPRGVCGYYLMPIYVSDSFDARVIEWVHSYHRYRWAIWHEPVLYCRADNTGHTRADYGLYGSAFRGYLVNLVGAAFCSVSLRCGHEFPCKINGKSVESDKAEPFTSANGGQARRR